MIRQLYLCAVSLFLAIGNAWSAKITLYGYAGHAPLAEDVLAQARLWGQTCAAEGHEVAGAIGSGNIEAFTQGYGQELKAPSCAEDVNPYIQKSNIKNCFTTQKTYIDLKEWLFNYGEAIVVLPCGVGGLAATLEALRFSEWGYHTKPIYLLGTAFWTPLVTLLKDTEVSLNNCHVTDDFPKNISIGRVQDKSSIDTYFKVSHHKNLGCWDSMTMPYQETDSINEILNHLIGFILEHHETELILKNKDGRFEPLKNVLDYLHTQGFLSTEHQKSVTFKVPNPRH